MIKHIKFSKNATWLKPYIRAIKDLIPIDKLASIKGYRLRHGLTPDKDGLTKIYRNKFYITLRMWEASEDGKKYIRFRFYSIFEALAHELAHCAHWEHTPDHFKLTARILMRFARVMVKEGITDTSERFSSKLMDRHIDKNKSTP